MMSLAAGVDLSLPGSLADKDEMDFIVRRQGAGRRQDSVKPVAEAHVARVHHHQVISGNADFLAKPVFPMFQGKESAPCLLYTSDAADDLLCVDLGGRR